MGRQPFLSIYRPGMSFGIGPGCLAQRPHLAGLIGQCIAMWNDAELQMALSLGAILKVNSDAAVALYLAIRTSRTQRDAMSAVARLLLSKEDLEVFEAVLSVYGSLEKQRNALAHGLFGVADDLPDAVLWSDIQDHANFLINLYNKEYQNVSVADPHEKLRRDMYVYTKSDLQELLGQLVELQRAVFYFHCHHQPRPSKTHNYLIDLVALPLMAAELKRTAKP
ncbi:MULTISPECIES: hypothetical protein [Bradyrhizobium]|jgi:hypothetical protein|uniref:hypothetical protein n=1 Tax=Bradyrhizobium TaxID=374 RepID=UPI0020A0E8EC|nr:hypothetical protein [Bradyrhizobium japonicum]MCP1768481.1 hypothetical protein [Bradyrhizobium japonicum]MCP1794642.1 hypothetical protein [Bradyrhizobium japonicum]MCP1811092.1 hypothetical protein [Bradyrhizobium japonicum]MCP1821055.1 hypothetical protein [Bradyrhizobium japonicum]MCP1876091.1 hypothetical protein [Bradyrhizobium japonicum]